MQGFVLYRTVDSEDIRRFDSARSSRKRLRTALDEGIPGAARVLGIVLIPEVEQHLHAVDLELKAS